MSSQYSEYFFASSINIINKDDWNSCVGDDHPFTRYEYLHALEESKSVIGNKFCGLPLDEDSESDMTDERLSNWANQLKSEMTGL